MRKINTQTAAIKPQCSSVHVLIIILRRHLRMFAIHGRNMKLGSV